METIRGIATRLFNRNEETGNVFALISYDSPNGPVNAAMRANAPDLQEGDYFVADGMWTSSTYRGKPQEIFSARFLRPHIPETQLGALRWFLGIFDDRRHGVTESSAKAFVEKLGDKAALICERDPTKLIGISKAPHIHGDAILRDWGRRVSGRRAVRLLEDAGIDRRAIDSLLDAYRDSAFDMLQEDPYKAARVPRFGFSNADLVGSNMGIDSLDARRISAAVLESLNQARAQGDTAMAMNEVADILQGKFGIDQKSVIEFVATHIGNRRLPFVLERANGRILAMPRDLHEAELSIARNAIQKLSKGRKNGYTAVDSVLSKVFQKESFARFDSIQREAVAMALREPLSILSGGPGTGKSTVTEAISEAAEAMESGPILLCAPTGKATKRLEEASGRSATTLHRLLEAKENKRTGGSDFGRNAANPLPSKCFVVCDEASMIDAITMQALIEAMPSDGRLLLVGDRNQLSSVDAGSVLSDLLTAKLDGNQLIPCTELLNVYRQSRGSSIAGGAAEIRDGTVPYMTNQFDGSLILYEHSGQEIMERIKWIVMDRLIGRLRLRPTQFAVLVPQAPGPIGTWAINKELSRLLNPKGMNIPGISRSSDDKPEMPIPRVGDRVMLTENDDAADVMNGDMGTIIAAFSKKSGNVDRPHIRIDFDCGKTVEYPAALWRRLSLAYAITVHKSQGSQYAAVVMPVSSMHENMLDRSILYTGWTRAKQALFLVGEREAIQSAVDNVEKSKRNTRLREYLANEAMALGYLPSKPSAPTPPKLDVPAVKPAIRMGFRPNTRTQSTQEETLPGMSR